MAKGVVVCYWGSGEKRGGHLALAVEADAGMTYITWVPTDKSGDPGNTQGLHDDFRVMTGIRGDEKNRDLALGMGQLRPNQVRTNRLSNTLTKTPTTVLIGSQSHQFNYGQIYSHPDETIEIPAIDANGGTRLGLDVDRIFHWWVGFALTASQQRMNQHLPWKKVSTSRNCCSVVYRALAIGGASYYRSKWFKRCYLTPTEVLNYATKLKDTIDELNRNNAAVGRSVQELSARMKGLTTSGANVELPTLAAWKEMSRVKVGRRKEQIAVIDRALELYWSAGSWPNDGDVSDVAVDTRDEKAKNLCSILGQAATHAALKPKSDRKHAVAMILTQAWLVLKSRVRGNVDMQLWGDGDKNFYNLYDKAYDSLTTSLVQDSFEVL